MSNVDFALEVGMRLTLGLEWILQGYGESEDTSRTKSFSAEERVSKFHVRADVNSQTFLIYVLADR